MSTNGWREGVKRSSCVQNTTPSSFSRLRQAARRIVVYCSSSGRKWLVGWPQGRWSHAQKPKYEVGGLPACQPSTPRRKGKNGGGRGPDGARSRSGSDCRAVTSGDTVCTYVCTVQIQTQLGYAGPHSKGRRKVSVSHRLAVVHSTYLSRIIPYCICNMLSREGESPDRCLSGLTY